MTDAAYVIVLNGTYGVGKSAALDHVGDLLAAASRPFSLMDVDWFHRSWPPAGDDPDNVLTEAGNLAAVWAGYRRAGPRQLVLSGVLVTQQDHDRYARALGMPVRSVRLEAGPALAEARLRRRYTEHQAVSLQWHLDRYADLAARLAAADLDELVVDTDALAPYDVATRVLGHFGLG